MSTSTALKDFDSLPDSALVGIPVVLALTGKTRPTIYAWINTGALPRPRKLGPAQNTRLFWSAGEIRAALAGGAAA